MGLSDIRVNGCAIVIKKDFTVEDWEATAEIDEALQRLNGSDTKKVTAQDIKDFLKKILSKQVNKKSFFAFLNKEASKLEPLTDAELSSISLQDANKIISAFFLNYNKLKIDIARNWQNSAKEISKQSKA